MWVILIELGVVLLLVLLVFGATRPKRDRKHGKKNTDTDTDAEHDD